MKRLLLPLFLLVSWILIFMGWENFVDAKHTIKDREEMSQSEWEYEGY
ncbi:hypothetical protein [Evansella clarkii]|nr:hypothetical protein [Evansella clarkii]